MEKGTSKNVKNVKREGKKVKAIYSPAPQTKKSKGAANRVINRRKNRTGLKKFKDNRPGSKSIILLQTVLQRKKTVTDNNMDTVAADVTNSDQNTVAITKEGTKYKWYSQHNIGSQKEYISSEYTNLQTGSEGNVATGVHAESYAVDCTSANINKIAASRAICKRCQASLAGLNITRINNGSNYTKNWKAPTHYTDIDATDTFPAIAVDNNKDGKSGKRWIRESGTNKPVKKSVWNPNGNRQW